MKERFFERLSRALTYLRRRNALLTFVAFVLVITALFLLVYARASAAHTGEIPWVLYAGVAACVGVLILLNVVFERDWF
jgi:uncharacterized BrkB/YihY/UPF0761 family membrane protein